MTQTGRFINRKKRRDREADKSKGQVARRRLYLHLIALGLGLAAIAAGTFYLLHGQRPGAQSITPAETQESGRRPGAKTAFESLQGRWLRLDGGYVLEIRGIDDNGKMVAAYFNPRPINVSRADASREGTTIKVFIELWDKNYPGSAYTLTYDSGSDQLKGTYFQAALHQSFDVVFVRIK